MVAEAETITGVTDRLLHKMYSVLVCLELVPDILIHSGVLVAVVVHCVVDVCRYFDSCLPFPPNVHARGRVYFRAR